MNFDDIKAGFVVLLAVIAGIMIFKHWKNGAWVEIISVLAIGGIMWALFTGKDIFAIMWALFTGKDIFAIMWDFITAILKVFGVNIA